MINLVYVALGLEPGPLGHAYIVPYGDEAQFQIGYKGILKLARNSGEIKSIEARPVYPADHFFLQYGLEEKLEHVPNFAEQEGEPHVFYGLAKFTNGGNYLLGVKPEKIDEHRQRSKAAKKGPWVTDTLSMQLKTVIRIMQPWLPLSAEAQIGMLADGAVSVDLSGNMAEEAAAKNESIIDVEPEETVVEFQPADEPPVDEDDPGRPFEDGAN